MYSDRVATGRAPASPRDHIIFGGPRANQQAGTKFAGGGFPYMFVIVRSRGVASIAVAAVRSSDKLVVPGAGGGFMGRVEGGALAGAARDIVEGGRRRPVTTLLHANDFASTLAGQRVRDQLGGDATVRPHTPFLTSACAFARARKLDV
jgi:hypothetical protein